MNVKSKRARTSSIRPGHKQAIREAAERFGQRLQQQAYERIGTEAERTDDMLTFLFGDGRQVEAFIAGALSR